MKITRKNPRRVQPPLPELASLISSILSASDDEVSSVLATVPSWPWPRGDLHSWTPVLNRFDAYLERTVDEYSLKTLQVNEFAPSTRANVLEILRFEKMLLEHCTNRKIYASFDRLGDLLFTQDLDVLEATLRLVHRPAQMYSGPNATAELSTSSVIVKRLLSLSQGWGPTREAGFSLAKLASDGDDDLELPAELGEVQFQFYRRPGAGDRAAAAKEDPASPTKGAAEVATPTPAGQAASTSTATTPHAPPPPQPFTATVSHPTPALDSTPMKPKSKLLADIKDAFRTPSANAPGTPSAAPATGGPSSTTHEGLTTLVLGNVGKLASTKSPMAVLADVVEEHSVPEEERFELLNRIRIAMGMNKKDTRRKMLSVRCWAIATYCHLVPESNAQTDLFLYEPELVSHIAELIHSESSIPYDIQTAAISALDAMSRYRHRIAEVISSINASANHGVLMSLFRSMVVKLAEDKPDPPFEFVEALITFITYLIASAVYSNMLIGAGLVPLLVQLVQNQLPSRLPIVVKSINLLDHVVYSNPNGFTIFRNAGGLEALTDRIQSTVDQGIESHGSRMDIDVPEDSTYGILPFPRYSALKALLRSISRMMQTTGTADGLRNLIDGSLPKSVKKIMEYRKVFGATVFSHALSVMATFVHNEPTSLAVLQEAKLPEAFYDAIEADIEPAAEVIFGIPNVLGALCLNQAGLDQLTARPTVIPKMIDILTSERHLKILQEKETSHQMGNYIDELIRHHPSLKLPILNAIIAVLHRLKTLGAEPKTDEDSVYSILPREDPSTSSSSKMAVDESSAEASSSTAASAAADATTSSEPKISVTPTSAAPPPRKKTESANPTDSEAYVDNLVVLFIGVTARFLEGLFHTQGHCKEFIRMDGLVLVLDLYTMPSIPYDFAGSGAADALFGLFRAVGDVEPNAVLKALLKPVRVSLDEISDFWQTIPATSRLAGMSDLPPGPELDAANLLFRRLVCLHGRAALLADMYRGVGFSQAKVATGFLQILNLPEETKLLKDLGKFHRACTWENILIKSAIPQAVVSIIEGKTPGPRAVARGTVQTAAGVPEDVLSELATVLPDGSQDSLPAAESVRTRNGKAFKYLVSQCPASLTPFFQAILKFLMFKRGTDANHKKLAVKVAETISGIMVDHLRWGQDAPEPLDPISYYAYGTLVVGFTTVLILDERAMSQGSIQTMLLSSFEHVGGIEALLSVASRYANAFEALDSAAELPALDNVHIFSGLKVTLNLLNTLVSSKALFDAPHTAALTTRDRTATNVDDFDPHKFLVKLRLAILPFIRDIWRSSWLPSAPVSVSRSVVQALLRIMDAELEVKPETPAGGSTVFDAVRAAPSLPRPPPTAERIQQLVDMGFTEHAATQALTRCHNNLNLAAEFLLTHPGIFPAPPPPAAVAAPAEGPPDAAAPAVQGEAPAPAPEPSGSGDAEMADAPAEGESSSKGKEKEKENEEPAVLRWEDRRPELNEERDKLRSDLSARALALADEHETLVFDIKPAFLDSAGPVNDLVEQTFALRAKAFDEETAKVAVRLRLLALILHEGSPTIVKDATLIERAMALVVVLAEDTPAPTEDNKATSRPKWLASQLLIVEALFVLSEDIKDVPYDKDAPEDAAAPASPPAITWASIFTGPAFEAARRAFFDRSIELLGTEDAPRDELASTLRLLVLLTRDHQLAVEFAKRDGVALVSKPFQSSKRTFTGCQSYVAIIVRHVVEEPKALLALMQHEVKQWFSSGPRSKVVDVTYFVKNTKQIALRNPELFIKAVQAECAIVSPSPTGAYHIQLKQVEPVAKDLEQAASTAAPTETAVEGADAGVVSAEPPNDMQVDEPMLPAGPDSDVLEAMVHHLLGELMLVGKKAVAPQAAAATVVSEAPKPAESTIDAASDVATAGSETPKVATSEGADGAAPSTPPSEAVSDYVYSCLLLQNLTELLGSYMSCKTAFLTMGRRRGGKDSLLTAGKPRTAMLNFIIQDLLCCTSLAEQAPPVKAETKKAISIANCAMSVLVALCSDVSAGIELKDVSPDLIAVRKVVLDAISKAIRDTISSADHIDVRYGRLHSLSDLCYRLLTARASVQPKGHDDGTLHIAKIMLEKNFAVTLTNALAEIDLNYPDVKIVVTDILKPLEHLTKISIKMGRASDKKKDPSKQQDESDDEVDTSDMDDDEGSSSDEMGSDGDDGEMPDLYRNSALGMYGGEMEEGYDDESGDEDMEEGYDEGDMSEGPTESGTESGSDDEDPMEEDLIADEEWEDEDEDGPEGMDESDDDDEIHFDPDGNEAGDMPPIGQGAGEDEDDLDDMEEGMDMMDDGEGDDDDGELDGDEEEIDFENELDQLEAGYDMPPPPDTRLTNWGWTQASDRPASDPYAVAGRSRGRYLEIDPAEMDAEGGGGGGVRARIPAAMLRQLAEPGQGYAVMPIGEMGGGGGGGAQRGVILTGGGGAGGGGGGGDDILSTIERLMGGIGGPGAAVGVLEQLINRGRPGEAVRLAIPAGAVMPGGGGHMPSLGEPRLQGVGSGITRRGPFEARPESGSRSNDPFTSQDFVPLPTSQRWLDEERITQGRFTAQRVTRLTAHVVNALIPAAREHERKMKEEDEKAEKEQKAADEQRLKEAEESMTALRNQTRESSALLAESVPLPHSTGAGTPAVQEGEDVEMADAPAVTAVSADVEASASVAPEVEAAAPPAEVAAAAPAVPELSAEASSSTSTAIPEQTMEDAAEASPEERQPEAEAPEAEAGPSQAAERVTITIHSEEVDITDTGIDITFLEALPDDMREEVVREHLRNRRPAARPAASAPTEINSEFLDALPPDIRAEILQQEAVEQSRRDREAASRQAREAAAAAGGTPAAQPAEIDPASFLASLDPELREQVLLEQEDGFLQSLPGELLAGMQLFGGEGAAPPQAVRRPAGRRGFIFGDAAAPGPGGAPVPAGDAAVAAAGAAKKPAARDAIQLLDKAGIASLVRLLFFPEVSRKAIVPRVLVNLCENSKTRAELLNLLLTVVQDGTGDLSAVDKSFAQMTLRGGKANTPKATPKKKGFPETPGPAGLFAHLSAESIPTFIAQRCFDALAQIVGSIERASFFFLTEHDVLVGLKRAATKKGKGKEKQILQTKYPLVVLLGLLDRPSLLKNSSMMDALTSLLVNVTRPLTTLPPPSTSDAPKDGMSNSLLSLLSATVPPSSTVPAAAPAPATPATAPAASAPVEGAPAAEAGPSDPKPAAPAEDSSPVLSHPPQVPNNVLRLVVNVLTVGDCSSATFKSALTLIHHLSFIPDARDIITTELRSQAQEFGHTLQTELDELCSALRSTEEHAKTVAIAKFTPASSTQAKLLRVLKTLEHIFSTKPAAAPAAEAAAAAPAAAAAGPAVVAPVPAPAPVPAVAPEAAAPADPTVPAASSPAAVKEGPTAEQEAMTSVYSSFSFAALWAKLSECLAIVAENESLNDVATVLLPVIEALMVVSRYASASKPSLLESAARGSLSPRSPSMSLEPAESDVFLMFTDTHRKILNDLLRNNPALMSGSFSLLIQNSKVLSFENKRAYFNQQLRKRPNRDAPATLQVNVKRDRVFEDSFSKFHRWSPEQIKYGKLSCRFWDEEGVDAGGVAREWFSVLAKSIFNPNFALFEPASSGASTYQFNKLSAINPDHLAFFRFVGVVLAKAVQDGRLLDAHFVRSIYRQLLGAKNMGLSDLEIVDPSYHTSLKWMIENPIEDLVELSFSVESDAFGEVKIHDLIPDGRNVPVTDENKMDYIQRMVNYQLSDSVSDQSKAFIEGFTSIIPQSLLKIYDAGELELLISGLPTIDVDELKNSVQLVSWKNSDPEIVWLWRAIRSYSQAERASFLQFISGSARVPLGGFSQLVGSNGVQPVQIHKAHGDPDRIPTAHTCFNQLDLGKYSSYEALREKLTLAITEGATGFGFA